MIRCSPIWNCPLETTSIRHTLAQTPLMGSNAFSIQRPRLSLRNCASQGPIRGSSVSRRSHCFGSEPIFTSLVGKILRLRRLHAVLTR